MVSPQSGKTLRADPAALQIEAGWCESLAATLTTNTAPPSAAPSPLSSAAAVALVSAHVARATANCAARMQATAAKLNQAGGAYSANEADATARMQAVAPPTAL